MDANRSQPFARPSINRRQFLKIVAAGSVSALALKLGLDSASSLDEVHETRLLMGTVVNITVLTGSTAAGQAALEAAFDRMQDLEKVLSRFQPDSQLSRLNRDGRLEGAAPALLTILDQALQVSKWSGGAFDVSVKPLVDLYLAAQREKAGLPESHEIEAALARVDYRQIGLEGSRVVLGLPGMGITLDGIAKGYIVDQGSQALKEHGFTSVTVEAGGDLYASNEKAAGDPWVFGVRSPRSESGEVIARLATANRAVATSGDYQQPFTADYRHHHILDPRTGYSSPGLSSVTVVSPGAALTDALATALMVMDVPSGLEMVRSIPETEALLVTKDLEVIQTGGFPLEQV